MHPPPIHSIRDDVPCITCGYNLRGLLPNGICPECGERVRMSMRLRWLAEPANKVRHQHGLAMQATAFALMAFAALPIIWAASFILRFEVPPRFYLVASQAILMTIALAIFIGTRAVPGETRFTLRWPLRATALLATAILFLLISKPVTKIEMPLLSDERWWNLLCVLVLATLIQWAIEVLPSTNTFDATPLHAARGLGFATIGALSIFLAVALMIGVSQAGCLSIGLGFVSTGLATMFFWAVGREMWS